MLCVCISDDWLMFDDDNVVPVKAEDILKLSGGGETLSFPALSCRLQIDMLSFRCTFA